jgi:hypothetical protein
MEQQAKRLMEDVAYEQDLRRQLADQLEQANKVRLPPQTPVNLSGSVAVGFPAA